MALAPMTYKWLSVLAANGTCVYAVQVQRYVKITVMLEVNVAQRRFYIWKLELWWIAFDKEEFYPENRIHIKGNWFWRK